jgi:hypothetical protein
MSHGKGDVAVVLDLLEQSICTKQLLSCSFGRLCIRRTPQQERNIEYYKKCRYFPQPIYRLVTMHPQPSALLVCEFATTRLTTFTHS